VGEWLQKTVQAFIADIFRRFRVKRSPEMSVSGRERCISRV